MSERPLTKIDKRGLALLREGPLEYVTCGLWCRPGDTRAFLMEDRAIGTSTVKRLVRRGLAERRGGRLHLVTTPNTKVPCVANS